MTRLLLTLALVNPVACLTAFGLAHAAEAQQSASPRHIGVLLVAFLPESKEALEFTKGLRQAGYAPGRDVVIEWLSANGENDRIPDLAADLVRRKPDVIVVDGTVAALAVSRATASIPIVMTLAADPVGSGLVASLAHPGGNVTGFSAMAPELWVKRLQLLKDILPELTRVAVLWNPSTQSHVTSVASLKAAAPLLSIKLNLISVRTPEDIGPAFSDVVRSRAQALCVLADSQMIAHRSALLSMASKARVPALYPVRRFVDEGGLISYGTNFADLFHRTAGYVDKILKGAKPGELPIEQPTKLELVVNLKTAKTLGITVPESILLRADEVIR